MLVNSEMYRKELKRLVTGASQLNDLTFARFVRRWDTQIDSPIFIYLQGYLNLFATKNIRINQTNKRALVVLGQCDVDFLEA